MLQNERSFLIKETPDLKDLKPVTIQQDYPHSDFRYATESLNCGDKCSEELNKLDLGQPLKGALRHLFKVRYYQKLDNSLTAEIDFFIGLLIGLTMVKVSFSDEVARASFRPPAWFGREITDEEWARGSFLVGKIFAQIKTYL